MSFTESSEGRRPGAGQRDTGEAIVTFGGDMLEMSATVEDVAWGAKRRALGWPE